MKIDLHHLTTLLGTAGLIATSIADHAGHTSYISLYASGLVTAIGVIQRAVAAYESSIAAPQVIIKNVAMNSDSVIEVKKA